MLPTFMIIGAAKSGTTSLYHYLDAHPEVYFPYSKEPSFFVEEYTWNQGIEWYESIYAEAGNAKALGDGSTGYTMYPHFDGVPARIKSVLPDVRLIYLMRDPLARLRSLYSYAIANGTEHRPIGSAILGDPRYLDYGRYAMQIEQYLKHFDRSQILLLTTEDLNEERIKDVYRFIGVDESFVAPNLGVRYLKTDEMTAPKWWWLKTGQLLTRAGLLTRLPTKLQKLNEMSFTRRSIRKEEMTIPPQIEDICKTMLMPEIERLAQWMEPGFDGWGWL